MSYADFKQISHFDKNRLTCYNRVTKESTALNTTVIQKVMGKNFKLTCPCCHKRYSLRSMELDHIVARQDGGQDTVENTCFICACCHNDKSALETLGMQKGKAYKTIQNQERCGKLNKKVSIIYKFFEYISRTSTNLLEQHPRYCIRRIFEKLVELFRITKKMVESLLKNFSNRYTLRKAERIALLNS